MPTPCSKDFAIHVAELVCPSEDITWSVGTFPGNGTATANASGMSGSADLASTPGDPGVAQQVATFSTNNFCSLADQTLRITVTWTISGASPVGFPFVFTIDGNDYFPPGPPQGDGSTFVDVAMVFGDNTLTISCELDGGGHATLNFSCAFI